MNLTLRKMLGLRPPRQPSVKPIDARRPKDEQLIATAAFLFAAAFQWSCNLQTVEPEATTVLNVSSTDRVRVPERSLTPTFVDCPALI